MPSIKLNLIRPKAWDLAPLALTLGGIALAVANFLATHGSEPGTSIAGSLTLVFVLAQLTVGLGCLMLLGALEQSRFGYEGTLRALAYANTAQLAAVVPLVGWLIGMVWTLVLLVIGFEVLHDTTQGRALAAALIPLLVCCLCGALLVIVFGAAIAGLVGSQL